MRYLNSFAFRFVFKFVSKREYKTNIPGDHCAYEVKIRSRRFGLIAEITAPDWRFLSNFPSCCKNMCTAFVNSQVLLPSSNKGSVKWLSASFSVAWLCDVRFFRVFGDLFVVCAFQELKKSRWSPFHSIQPLRFWQFCIWLRYSVPR